MQAQKETAHQCFENITSHESQHLPGLHVRIGIDYVAAGQFFFGDASPLGKPYPPKKRVYLGIAQIAMRKSGHFVAQIFCQKLENSLNSNFVFGNEYFDSD